MLNKICKMKNIYISIVLIFALSIFSQSENKIEFKTLTGSKVWIEGSSTINDFICGTQIVEGYGYVLKESDSLDEEPGTNEASLSVKVFTLDCGKERMNDDMYEAMKADEFPFIKFELTSAEEIKNDKMKKNNFDIKVTGDLSIAGKSNSISMIMNVKKLRNETFRVTGSRELMMKDFDITPPSAFWGLIKAHDEIVVHFDLIVARY